MRNKPLEGKVALVTGAGSPKGLGYNMTEALIEAGGRVAMMDVHKEWLEQSSNDLLERFGDDCLITLPLDVSDPHDAETAVMATIGAMGGLHILINNAGTNAHKWGAAGDNFWDISPEIWSKVLSINLNGPFFMAQAAVVHMAEQGWGRIIGVTTSLDTMIRQKGTPYGPAKAGHEALMAAMAGELEGTGVTANVLVPGGRTNTNLLPDDPTDDRSGIIQPEVMRKPVVWLASEASDGVNGRRIIAQDWDESLPIEQRLEKASGPTAWPQLGRQAV
jgi:NAD(P)-dependent dehydrogenase (short-subunit alcohol dehydrogenase family)